MSQFELAEGLAAFVLMGLIGWAMVAQSTGPLMTKPMQLKLFFSGFAVRAGLSVALYVFGLAATLGDFDSSGWQFGASLASRWDNQHLGIIDLPTVWGDAFHGNHLGYYYLVGSYFFVTGFGTRLAAAALNCLIGALTAVVAYRVAYDLFSESVARRVGWWTCLFPSMVVWSAQTLKEPVVILLETIVLYGCVRLRKNGFSAFRAAMTGLGIVALLAFRFYAAYIAAAAVMAALVVPDQRKRKISIGPMIAVVGLMLVIVTYMGVLSEQEARLGMFDMQFVQDFRTNVAAEGGSGVATDFDMTTTTGFGLGTLVGAAYLLLAPFPWQLGGGSFRMLLTTPELVFWWYLFFFGVVPGFSYVLKWRLSDMVPLLVFVVGMGLLYSMMFGNVGLIFRQRAQILPWLFVLASVGLEARAVRLAAQRPRPLQPPAA